MSLSGRIEAALGRAMADATSPPAPAGLSAAMTHAVFPGGARIRPLICLSVAQACGERTQGPGDSAAAAIELMHCASLVHDDLPSFDDADVRRGRPSVHVAYGESLALLAGDALIVLAFETALGAAREDCARGVALALALAAATGAPRGICAGQAWESESLVDLSAYHAAKTGSLFVAATRMGAIAGGADPAAWGELGARIGEAFQIADDLRDVVEGSAASGKPAGQDARHRRPSAVEAYGVSGAANRLRDALAAAIASIPACPGEAALCATVRAQAERLSPVGVARRHA